MITVFKVLGMLLLFSVCALLGFYKAAVLAKRAKALETMVCRLKEMAQYLSYEGAEREKLLQKVFGGCDIVDLENGRVQLRDNSLDSGDTEIITDCFSKFGSCDLKGERERLDMYIGMLSDRRENAAKSAAELGRVYRTIGLCAGAAGCLLLI